MTLSLRGQEAGKPSDSLGIWDVIKNLWDPEQNPSGYLSLGVAENTLMHESLVQHARHNFDMPAWALTYGDGTTGSKRLRTAMASFLTEHLHAVTPIAPGHITVTNGCSASIEHLSWALANPGDGVLLGRPFFRGFVPSIELRTGCKMIPVSFPGMNPFKISGVQAYEDAINKARDQGQKVSALMLCSPHNPTGRCYTRDALIGLMRLCEKYQIHLISDEIYALSSWDNVEDADVVERVPFVSCLAIDPTGLIDPSRLHIIWGISKDLGANGLRMGAIISQHNAFLHQALIPVALYSSSSSAADHLVTNLLEDSTWMKSYLAENSRLLSKSYSFVADWTKRNRIAYAPGATAAFFLWVNLGEAYCARHVGTDIRTAEKTVDGLLLKHKVWLAAGSQFGAEEPGWFRITFACSRAWIEEGLSRVLCALDDVPCN